MKRRMRGLVSLVFAFQFLWSLTPALHSAQSIQTCDDFAYQDDAQKFYESGGGRPQDWYGGMDQDNDGVACEHLPAKPLYLKTGFQVAAGGGVGLLVIGGGLWWARRRNANSQPAVSDQSKGAQASQAQPITINNQLTVENRAESRSVATATANAEVSGNGCPWIEDHAPYQRSKFEDYPLSGHIPTEVLQRMPYAAYLKSYWWKKTSAAAKRRAGHRCERPGCESKGALDVHHKRYDRGNESPEDLVVLCRMHHKEVHQIQDATE